MHSEELIKKEVIDEKDLKNARIEEYVLGQKFNANFQTIYGILLFFYLIDKT